MGESAVPGRQRIVEKVGLRNPRRLLVLDGRRVTGDLRFHEVDHEVSEATQRGIDAAIDTLRGLGAVVSKVTLSPLAEWHACGTLISLTERAAAYEEWSRARLGDFSERLGSRLMLGAFVSGVDYVQAVRRRRELRAELQQAMSGLPGGAHEVAERDSGHHQEGGERLGVEGQAHQHGAAEQRAQATGFAGAQRERASAEHQR